MELLFQLIYVLFILAIPFVFIFSNATKPKFWMKWAGQAFPRDLAAIRIIVCSIAFLYVASEDLVSSALLPASMRMEMGVMAWLYYFPSFSHLARSFTALAAFQCLLILCLLFGAAGLFTRVSVPCSALLYVVFGGFIRQNSHYFHTGLTVCLLLIVLSFMPCGDDWSIDTMIARFRKRAWPEPFVKQAIYGLCRFTCWSMVSILYVEAAATKVRRSGLEWVLPDTLRPYFYQFSLSPMDYDWSLGLLLHSVPGFFISVAAIVTLLIEFAFLFVPFSRWARRIAPPLMALLHLAILFTLNILFLDSILVQSIFWDFSRSGALAPSRSELGSAPVPAGARWLASALFALFCAVWILDVEFYPLTVMPMFSKRSNGEVVYYKPLVRLGSGEVIRAPIEQTIPGMKDFRFRQVLFNVWGEQYRSNALEFLDVFVKLYNAGRPPPKRIVELVIEEWNWDYHNAGQPIGGRPVRDFRIFYQRERGKFQAPRNISSESRTSAKGE